MNNEERDELIRMAAEAHQNRISNVPASPSGTPPEQAEKPVTRKTLPPGLEERVIRSHGGIPPGQETVPPPPPPVTPEPAVATPPIEKKSTWKQWSESAEKHKYRRFLWRAVDGYFNQFDPRDKNKLAWGSGIFAGAGGVLLVAEAGATFGFSPMLRGATTFAVLQGSRLIYEYVHGKYVAGALSVANTEELRVKILNKEREMAAKKLHGAAFETEYKAILADLLKDYVAAEHLEHYQQKLLKVGREYAAVNRVMRSLTAGLASGAVGGAITEGLIDRFLRPSVPTEPVRPPVPTVEPSPTAQPTGTSTPIESKPTATPTTAPAKPAPSLPEKPEVPTATPTTAPAKIPSPVATPAVKDTIEFPSKPGSSGGIRPSLINIDNAQPSMLDQGVSPKDIPGTPEFNAAKEASGSGYDAKFYLDKSPDSIKSVMNAIANNTSFGEQIAGEVGYFVPELDKLLEQAASDQKLRDMGITETSMKKMRAFLLNHMQQIAEDRYFSQAATVATEGNVDPKTVIGKITERAHSDYQKWFTDPKIRQSYIDYAKNFIEYEATNEKNMFYGKVMHGFEVNPGMMTEVSIKPGTTAGTMLVEAGFDLRGVNAARPMAATIAANWDTLTEMWSNMQQTYPTLLESNYYPVSILELNDLVARAEAGDPEALKKLWAAAKWIPAGKKLRIINSPSMQKFLDVLR